MIFCRSSTLRSGRRRYRSALALSVSPTERARREVYGDLSENFGTYTSLLEEVRESTAMRTPQDIVRLYEKWKKTGSPLLAERLRSEGVYPSPGGKLLH